MDAPAQPDDPNHEKSAVATPRWRSYVVMTAAVLLTLPLTAFLGGLVWDLWRNYSCISGCSNAVSIAIVGAFMLAGLGGTAGILFLAWRGRPVLEKVVILFFFLLLSMIAYPAYVERQSMLNGFNAVESLKSLVTAQDQFRKNAAAYAYPFSDLRNRPSASGEPLNLISPELAAADQPEKAYRGYYFLHGKTRAPSPDAFDLFATPAQYGRRKSGVYTFFFDQKSRKVLMRDLGHSLTPEEALTIDPSKWDLEWSEWSKW